MKMLPVFFLSYITGDHMKPEFLKLNPFHKIPIINHDGMVMSER